MKISVQKLIVIGLVILSAGLLIGWFIFSGSTSVKNLSADDHSHTEVINGETVWTCSMHPQIRQGEPGQCPICGMDLIPLEEDEGDGIDPMAISMSPTAMQLASVATAQAGSLRPVKNIQLNGKVQEDERLVYSQTSHFPGRIEKLMVNFTGEYVKKGQPIAYLYSPELVTAQEELFEAYKIREKQPNLYKAAREKLKNWKLEEAQIDAVINTGEAKDEFPINADHSGYVIAKNINLGDHVKAGQAIYEIADLSQVWVLFDIYESDLPWISRGDSVYFTVASLPGKTFEGKLDFIDPVINPQTRVAQARVVVDNIDKKLKPEMFASGLIKAELEERKDQLIIPESAVLWTGKRSVVYVKTSEGKGLHFMMREVVLGPSLENSYIVESGLVAGEEIAVSGAFSIDAAAQLSGKPSMMAPEGGAAMIGHNHGEMNQSSSQMDHSKHLLSEQLKVNKFDQTYASDPKFQGQLQAVFNAYLPVKDALIQSDAKTASQEAENLQATIDKVNMKLVKGEGHIEWMKDLEVLQESTEGIVRESDIEKARMMLSPLSDQLYHSLKKFEVKIGGYRQFCPMAKNNQGAFWLSNSEKILNPYFGDAMLTCGEITEDLN
ncbi:efflux RND transporter periplasmic adaptor subunit [Roseivirga spongicola]|uniref:efflux RND transporter periplasmic adaptor subunit n=1 Tax=Roseivirga spongicola TaxID=333140 RepID=UPI002AC8E460|nr:efflux RND transporter periplasmic adaptor subunit [Roseivirga spongicola]WPZ10952.1 efflux RND transporter periplasmic adaptor subunit [Roseivirga spongicola]